MNKSNLLSRNHAAQSLSPRAPFQGSTSHESKGSSTDKDDTTHDGPGEIPSSQGGAAEGSPARMAAEGVARRALTGRFKVNSQTGGVSCTIPIEISPGRNGFEPALSIQYASGTASTNGIFGVGWSLDGVDYISRKTTLAIPKYQDDTDTFVHSSLGDLVPVDQSDELVDGYRMRKYRPRFEAESLLVYRYEQRNETFWKIISSGNIATIYGRREIDQISASGGLHGSPRKIFSWLASEMYDGLGNHIKYTYKAEDNARVQVANNVFEASRGDVSTQKYLKSIQYGNTTPSRDLKDWDIVTTPSKWLFHVVFDYGEHQDERPTTAEDQEWEVRPDPFSTYRSGFEIRTYRRCRRVLMFHHFPSELGRQDCLVSSTNLNYVKEAHSGTSLLDSYTHSGHSPKESDQYWTLSLPTVKFSYSTSQKLSDLPTDSMNLGTSSVADMGSQWIDLDGEGAPGVLTKAPEGGWYYQRNLTYDGEPRLGEPCLVTTTPNLSGPVKWDFEDINLDSLPDVIVTEESGGLRGFYERDEEGGWVNFIPFESYPNVLDAESVRRVDLSGDGHADILRLTPASDGELIWHPSQGPRGFGIEHRTVGAPLLPISDKGSSIQLCDMTGDGLSDIVHIRNGAISYWPNMGHGTFGARIVMANSPWMATEDIFSTQCIRMADVTGSGTSDLIYVQARGGAIVYYNESGNSWSDGSIIPSFPPLDRVSAVDVLDLFGQGTPCLCWTSDLHSNVEGGGLGTVHFVDLMGRQRPGLLTTWSNGVGCETTFSYESSFSYYRRGEQEGRPWSTKLPFPMQCVAKVVTVDKISQTSHTKRYSYHNGYYDHSEKQFRGFQLVESWDGEEFETLTKPFQRPPVLTRSWFYTGLKRLDMSSELPQSYTFDGDGHSGIPSAIVPPSDDGQVMLEAYRALAGRERRSEIFSDDSSDTRAALPYLVTQKSYHVVMPSATPGQVVTRVNDREELTAHYERVTQVDGKGLSHDDAKIEHRLVIDTDKYGNVLLEALVQYGKSSSSIFNVEDQARQKETVVTYTTAAYTNEIQNRDCYFQVPLVCQVAEFRYFAPINANDTIVRYTWSEFDQRVTEPFRSATEVPLEVVQSEKFNVERQRGCRVLLNRNCTIYSSGDLTEPLSIGMLEQYSIVHQTFSFALANSLLNNALSSVELGLGPGILASELRRGGYVERPTDSGEWWIPSSRKVFGDGTPQSQLGLARSQFYMIDGDIDAYGNLSSTELDTFFILTKRSTNAVGSNETFENDYARLKPVLVTDENLNQTHTVFDPLSRPVGMARMGKRGDSIANTLDGFEAKLDEVDLKAFEQDPVGRAAGLLGKASTRTIYVLSRSESNPVPPSTMPGPGYTAELTRLNHLRAEIEVPDRISVRFHYHNGQCHVVQETVLSSQPSDHGKATWNFSGWVVYDNKAQPVQTFHPFEASSHHFLGHPHSQSLLATTLLRDPLDRVVGLLNADHTWSKTRFTPWNQMTFHAGQTATIEDPAQDEDLGQYFKRLDKSLYYPTWYNRRIAVDTSSEERHAASQAEIYSGACINVHVDAAGHAIVSETGNVNDLRRTRTFYNVWGQISTVHDALNRVVDTVIYHGQGTAIYKNNMDSGQRWVLPDIQGLPLVTWSDIGVRKRMTYDALRRLTGVMLLTKRDTASETQIVKNVYGEHAERFSDSNLSGELYQCYDQSGLRTNMSFDIQGGCTASSFRHAVEYHELVDWSDQSTPPTLENKEYRIDTSYNALGMVIESLDADLGHIQREYDISGRLQGLQSFDKSDREIVTSSVKIIEYEAGDQVSRIVYGNGSQTIYSYDPEMRQLVGTRSVRARDNAALQDISYTRDALGKVVQSTDKASVDPTMKDAASPTQQYWYDCHGQLVKATGRIQTDPDSKQIKPYSSSSDVSRPGGQLIRYTESYAYDLVGNLQVVQHVVQGGYSGWTRKYSYEESSCILPSQTSNRLSRTQVGNEIEEYRYDKEAGRVGCMTSIPGYSALTWDYDERLASFSTQRVTDGTIPEMTWYVYNATGNRVRKITERGSDGSSTPTRQKETRYLPMGNIFTRYRGDGVTESRTSATLEMGDPVLGRAPVVTIEVNSDINTPLASYQLNEKLVLDTDAKVISYQEFSPFGAKTYEAINTAAPRVYRFCSYRWDVESGLYFCEARYYACWLGRWLSADPLGTIDGLDLYVYVGNDPVNFDDHGGTCGKAKDNKTKSPVSMNQEQFPTLSASPFAQTTSQTKPVPTETTGADKSTNAWNTPLKKIAPQPGTIAEVKKVTTLPEETIPVYRTTFKARAEAFSDMGDLSSVITWYKGDFNHAPKTASYWSLTKEGALKHQYGEEEHVLLTMNVPKSVLQSGSVQDYGDVPTHAWRDRVNADRLGFTKSVSSEVTSARSKEVTIGPESMRSPGDFNKLRYQKGFKDPYDMYPSATKIGFNNWKYEPQVAFSGKQLQKLTQYSSSYRSLAPSEIRVSKK